MARLWEKEVPHPTFSPLLAFVPYFFLCVCDSAIVFLPPGCVTGGSHCGLREAATPFPARLPSLPTCAAGGGLTSPFTFPSLVYVNVSVQLLFSIKRPKRPFGYACVSITTGERAAEGQGLEGVGTGTSVAGIRQ